MGGGGGNTSVAREISTPSRATGASRGGWYAIKHAGRDEAVEEEAIAEVPPVVGDAGGSLADGELLAIRWKEYQHDVQTEIEYAGSPKRSKFSILWLSIHRSRWLNAVVVEEGDLLSPSCNDTVSRSKAFYRWLKTWVKQVWTPILVYSLSVQRNTRLWEPLT